MSTHTYWAVWPILDIDLPRSVLVAEACAALDAMAARDGAHLTGQPTWTVTGDRLVCTAPSQPLPQQPTDDPPADLRQHRQATRARRDAMILRLAALDWSSAQIAAATGVVPSTVRDVLARHDLRTAYAPGGHRRTTDPQAA